MREIIGGGVACQWRSGIDVPLAVVHPDAARLELRH